MPANKSGKNKGTSHNRIKKSKSNIKNKKTQSGGYTMNLSNVKGSINTHETENESNLMLWVVLIVLLVVVGYFVFQNNQLTQQIITNDNNSTMKNGKKTKEQYIAELAEDDEPLVEKDRQPGYNGLRMVGPTADNINNISYQKYIQMKNYDRVVNPLLPPERSYENTYGIPINVPSRGMSGGFQQVGMLYKDDIVSEDSRIGKDSSSVIMPLYGRPTYPGSSKWNYYVSSDKYHAVKMPVNVNGKSSDETHGVDELFDNDNLQLPAYNGNFVVKIYNYDKPRYIPYVL